MSLGSTLNCSSDLTAGGSAVTVMCTYDATMYSGYSVCIQDQMEFALWIGPPPMDKTENAYSKTYNLNVEPDTVVSTTG